MDGQRGVKKYFGNYDYYREKVAQEETGLATEDQPVELEQKENRNKQKEERRRKAVLRKQLQGRKKELEENISKLETDIDHWSEEKAGLLGELTKNTSGIDYAAINKRLKQLDNQIDAASEVWNTVADELDEVLEKYNVI